jgi:hypothetical protein
MIEKAMTDGMVFARASKILEGVSDGTLLVLRGHLLIEDALYRMVSAKLIYPTYLSKANLRFYQLLNMARALYPVTVDNEQRTTLLWDAVEALNTLRNRLAHRLEHADLPSLLGKILDIKSKDTVSLDDPAIIDRLGNTIAVIVGCLLGLGSEKIATNGVSGGT